jgi:hypothetical protein
MGNAYEIRTGLSYLQNTSRPIQCCKTLLVALTVLRLTTQKFQFTVDCFLCIHGWYKRLGVSLPAPGRTYAVTHFNILHNKITNWMKQTPSWKLIILHLVKKFPIFSRIWIFILDFKKPTTAPVPYPEPDKSSPLPPTLSSEDQFQCFITTMLCTSKCSVTFTFSYQDSLCSSLLACYIPRLFHSVNLIFLIFI